MVHDFNVRVCPKASRNLITREGDFIKVHLTKPACDGLANEQLVRLIADYAGVKKYQVQIIRGFKCRDKVVRISE